MEIVIKIIQNSADYSACCSKCRGAMRSVGQYLARRYSTPQNMIKRAYEQSQVAVHAWLDDPYPAIVEHAKIELAAFRIIF